MTGKRKNTGLKNFEVEVRVRDFDTNIFKEKDNDPKKVMRDLNKFMEDKGLI